MQEFIMNWINANWWEYLILIIRCWKKFLRSKIVLPSKSLEDLARSCEAISVVAPTDLHAEVSIPIMQEGCHVLIEKPLCVNLQEAEKILEVAQQNSSIIQVGHIEHYNPVMTFLEKAVKLPKYLTVERLAPFQTRGTEVGVVLDLMIHDIGIVMALVSSQISKIDAIGVRVLSPSEDIANARIVLKMVVLPT